MKYHLGIAQGGGEPQAQLAAAQGRLLGLGRAGGACHATHGMERALQEMERAVQGACQGHPGARAALDRLAAGVTGIDWPEEEGLLRSAISARFGLDPARVTAVNDCVIAMRAGTAKQDALAVCAGTGLNCCARNREGGQLVFGYYVQDDCQGASALADRTFRLVVQAGAGIVRHSPFITRVLDHFGMATVDAFLRARVKGQLEEALVRGLPLLLDQADTAGDADARRLLADFARDVSAYAIAAMERLGLLERQANLVLSGGGFKGRGDTLRRGIRQAVLSKAPGTQVLDGRFEPEVGAVMMALEDSWGSLSPQALKALDEDAGRLGLLRLAG